MLDKVYRWGIVMGAAALALAGCGGSGTSATPPVGNAGIKAVDVVARAGSFHQPLDAAPSPDGSVIYFVATGASGPAVFSTTGTVGAEATVAQGAPLAQPTGVAVATDGSRVFIADQQALPPGTTSGPGAILTAATGGGAQAPNVLPGTAGWKPRGLDVVNQGGSDLIYFTGTDPADGLPGLFEVSTAGGTITIVAEGAPFLSPDSVVVNTKGEAYVSDQGTGPYQGLVLSVSGGTVTPVVAALDLGSPAGISLINGDATLLVSSLDPLTASDQLLFFDLATGKSAAATKVIGVHKASSGGLHRAYHATVAAWADTQGTVYRVHFPVIG